MVHEIYDYSLDQLTALEEGTVFEKFDAEVAWKLGSYAREVSLQKFPNKAVIIDITLSSGHILFHTASLPGTTIDNDKWVQRKVNTVFRFGKSSFFMGQKLRQKKQPLEDVYFISSNDFATHGGSVPIRVKSHDGVIGALTISGLAQEEDHLLAVEILKQFNK
ncbi:uncharacterized protein SPAPADRAFT_144156 [Spathaspora passalidarum NRRL Y-27907]|uniref:Uncharacterized protein n=1 Tax=Spathaspora passalidarum (strain NRRL Y-27907 / 11-Y1) TaxID=619300 RepID=G3AVV1_SPAPN|nr:uncharacterized protein SPAPADRAFT_144156 [Spathaspora passalidarum NRRL Y-27907]EGW29996.1 hypothetical protein SPAPADRAFT_144156 [Spathaspora passalidarum NRRL Y-27907]